MQSGPATRSPKKQKEYIKHLKDSQGDKCSFCAFSSTDPQVISSYKNFWVVKNIFEYTIWDSCGVEQHYMIIPKRHVVSIGDYSTKESNEFMKLLATMKRSLFLVIPVLQTILPNP